MIECHSSASKSPWHDYVIHELKKHIGKALRYSKHGPLPQILPNYVASSSPQSVVSVFLKREKCGRDFVARFAKNELNMKACIEAF